MATKAANKESASEALDLVVALAATFGRAADQPLLLGYSMGLRGLTLPQIRRAVERALAECRFMPTPAELRELSGEIRIESRAAIAWTVAEAAVRQQGAYRSVRFDDPVLNAAIVRMGGWVKFCDTPEDQTGYQRNQFEKLYRALWESGVHQGDTAALLGVHAQENQLGGLEVKPPVMIETGLPSPRPGLVKPSLTKMPSQPARMIGVDIGKLPTESTPAREINSNPER